MRNPLVKDLMWKTPVMVPPETTLAAAARKMAQEDCGVLPVGADGRIAGVITDRDIVTRAIAKGGDPKTEMVKDHMTKQVRICRESDSIEVAARVMKDNNLSRIAVTDGGGKLSGVLSFVHLIRNGASAEDMAEIAGRAVRREAGFFRRAAAG